MEAAGVPVGGSPTHSHDGLGGRHPEVAGANAEDSPPASHGSMKRSRTGVEKERDMEVIKKLQDRVEQLEALLEDKENRSYYGNGWSDWE